LRHVFRERVPRDSRKVEPNACGAPPAAGFGAPRTVVISRRLRSGRELPAKALESACDRRAAHADEVGDLALPEASVKQENDESVPPRELPAKVEHGERVLEVVDGVGSVDELEIAG
jgi:hypothetical protein